MIVMRIVVIMGNQMRVTRSFSLKMND